MHAFAFRADEKITDVLNRGGFTLSAEILPPRNGAEQSQILSQIQRLVTAGSQFLAVTRGAGGSLRGGSLPIAQAIKEQFQVPAIAHFTCRDLTPHEIENQLIDHHYFGIRNILALRGDPPDGATDWKAREGCYVYAHQLIRQIRALNQGEFLKRDGGPQSSGGERTNFCIGAAAYPEHPDPKERIEFFRQKVEAGAEYAITDVLFDAEAYGRFVESTTQAGVGVPVLPGTRLLRSKPQADRMMKKFRVKVPAEIYARLADRDPKVGEPDYEVRRAETLATGLEIFHEFVAKVKSYGAPGIHVFVIIDLEGSERAISSLRR